MFGIFSGVYLKVTVRIKFYGAKLQFISMVCCSSYTRNFEVGLRKHFKQGNNSNFPPLSTKQTDSDDAN